MERDESKTITIRATPAGIEIQGSPGMTPDLLIALLWQAMGVVSAQVIQQRMSVIVPVNELRPM